ncbi:MAG: hypothetical protein GYA15_03755 [Leptolinea sp.]|jgi:uncharacterized protein YbdZ (MbtH family)|nr:hypothetical protein [Leptolinea sp.]
MNTGSNTLVEPSVAKMLDPYSNPRTIPGGWDVSAIQMRRKMSAMKKAIEEPSVVKMLDPYSNPRTIPGGWDVSAFNSPEKKTVDAYGDGPFNPGSNG